MRDLLAHARRWGLAALAAAAVTLALAAVASAQLATDAPATGGSADSTTVAQNGGPAENQTPATAACPTCALAITTASLPTPVLNRAYGQTIVATGGAAPITFTVSSGSVPAGLSLAPDGAITGTPTAAGPYSFTVKAADASSNTATQTYSGTIASTFAISTTTLPAPVLLQAYSQTIAASGGAAPIGFSVSSGSMPAGLSLANSGAITGTPTVSGPYSFTVKATDANSNTASEIYSGSIASVLALATASLPTPLLNQPYDQAIAATGGAAPVTFTVSSGVLPTGLSLAPSGALTGTPTAPGGYSFTVKAADASGAADTHTYSGIITATLAITATSLPTPALNQPYDQTIGATGGAQPISLTVAEGALPAGLYLSDGAIAGTPTAAGDYSFTIKAADANGATATQTYSGAIAGIQAITTTSPPTPALAIVTASLPTPVLNQNYSQTIATSGGAAPIGLSVSGTLPAGLYLADGAIAGTPTAAGDYSFTVKAADANGATATQTYSGTIGAGPAITATSPPTPGPAIATTNPPTPDLAIVTASLPTPVLNQNYSQTIATSGGAAPIGLSVSGTLPAGLYLADGAIAGTPTAAGDYSFTVKAADANGATATQTYSGTIDAGQAISAKDASPPATGSITVNAQPPVAGAVSATVGYNSTDNAINPDLSGGPADRVAVSTPAVHGSARARRTSVIYTPTRGYSGSDSFQYTAANAAGESSPATVSVTVNPQAPIARRVRETVEANSTNNEINLDLAGGPANRLAVSAQAINGKATASGGSISYTPDSDFAGLDSFQYIAANAGGTSAPATVSIRVKASNPISVKSDPPRVRDDKWATCASTDPDTSISGCITLIASGHLGSGDLAIAYNNKGIAEDAKGLYDQAIADFTLAIAARSDVAEIYFNRGVAYDNKGFTDQAIADYSRAIALRPDDANAYIHRGKDYRGKSLTDRAIADFTQAITLRPSSADAYDDRAGAYGSKGAGDEAIADLTEAIALRPRFAQAYIDRGAIYMNKGLFDQSITDSTEAIALKPNDASGYVNRAAAYIGKGLYDQAIADATRAIALEPDDALAYNNRAVADNRSAHFDQAIADASQAIALEPDYALAYLNRAVAEDARGRRDQTIADLRAALEIDPTLQKARDGLSHLGVTP